MSPASPRGERRQVVGQDLRARSGPRPGHDERGRELTDLARQRVSAERFARRAGPLLEAAVENTVLATVLDGIRHGRFAERAPSFALVTGPGEEVASTVIEAGPEAGACARRRTGRVRRAARQILVMVIDALWN